MTPENSKKPIRRGGLQLHPLQVCDRVDMVIKLPIPVGAEVRWCEHAASSKLGMLLGRCPEHLSSKFRPLRVIENGVQLATANHPSQTIHVRLARSRHCLWTPFECVLNGHGASNVRLWRRILQSKGQWKAGCRNFIGTIGVVRSEWAQCSDVAGIRTRPAYLGGVALYQPDGGSKAVTPDLHGVYSATS